METLQRGEAIVNICQDEGEVARQLAQRCLALAWECAGRSERFTVALSGGSTPRALYSLLAEPEVARWLDWERIHLFWGDERCVPRDSSDSNYRMVWDALISRVSIPPANIHAPTGQDLDPAASAESYELEIKQFFDLSEGRFPAFDLVLLGLGPDGHTASLFPGSAATHDDSRIVIANYVEKFKTYRLTFTFPTINKARNVIFMVSGAAKQEALASVIEGSEPPLPAQLVAPKFGNLEWFVDQAASARLNRRLLTPLSVT